MFLKPKIVHAKHALESAHLLCIEVSLAKKPQKCFLSSKEKSRPTLPCSILVSATGGAVTSTLWGAGTPDFFPNPN